MRDDTVSQLEGAILAGKRRRVFVSYSHHDARHLDRLRVHMRPLERQHGIDLWDDTRLVPGGDWRRDIAEAIDNAKVAILLVSADFLASAYIVNNELPPLLEGARSDGAVVIPVVVSPCRLGSVPELSSLQAANDPARPLTTLPVAERERVWVRVADAIEAAFANREPTDGWRVANEQLVLDALQQLVRAKVGSYLIVESGDYYVQFLTSAATLCLEVVSNTFLPKRLRLNRDKAARLVALGFRRPGSDHPNFDRKYTSPETKSQLRSLATLAVKVMADVFEVSQNARLQVQINLDP